MAESFSKLFAVVHRAWIGTGLAYSVGKIRYGLPPDAFDQVLACPNALEGMVGDVTQAEAEQDQLLSILRDELYVAVVSDVLDAGGLLEQAMDARLRPLAPGMRLVGRAHTVMTADVYVRPEEPYGPEIEAVDALRPGDVMVASTSRSERTCFWGELLSTAAVARGATGCAIDGHTRDALRIIDMGFPVFATGFRPVDSSSRSMVVGHGCPVEVGGVVVNPGDIIFGDYDGIVVIPPDRLADVVTAAHNKVTSENSSREMLQAGATLRDVYDRYGVL